MVGRTIEVTRRGRQGEQGNPGSTAFNAVTTAGTATAYTLTNSTQIVTYADGYGVTIDAHLTNGATPTINVDGLGAVPINKISGGASVAIAAGDMIADNFYMIHYSAVESAFILFGADVGQMLENVVEDTAPQLGGPLDTNGNSVYWSKGADVASAAELLLLTDGNVVDITGTTTITSIENTADEIGIGSVYLLRFNAGLVIENDATNLILPGGVDLTVAGGDYALIMKHRSGGWRMTFFSGVLPTADWEAGTSSTPSLASPASVAAAVGALNPFGNNLLHIVDEKAAGVDGGASGAGTTWERDLNTVRTDEIAGAGLLYDLAYDGQTADFTVGEVVTGGTSGATGVIVVDTDAGATGTLGVISITGTFADNEAITDPLGGAAVVNSAPGAVNTDNVWLPAGNYWMDASAPAIGALLHKASAYNVTDVSDILIGTAERAASTNVTSSRSLISGRFTLAAGAQIRIRHYTENANATGFGRAVGVLAEIYTDLKIWKL